MTEFSFLGKLSLQIYIGFSTEQKEWKEECFLRNSDVRFQMHPAKACQNYL